MSKWENYSLFECDFIKENYGKIFAKEIAKRLGRTAEGIIAKAKKLNLHSNLGRTYFLGRKHSKKTLKLMSEIKLGKKNPFWKKHHSAHSKHKKSIASKRLWKNPSFKKKMVKFTKQRWEDKEYRRMMSIRFLGRNNPNYRHGKSKEPYPFEWNMPFKEKIRQRDKRCAICKKSRIECKGLYGFDLIVHHIDRDKKNIDPSNLICLCHFHHQKIQAFQESLQDYFKVKLLNSSFVLQ